MPPHALLSRARADVQHAQIHDSDDEDDPDRDAVFFAAEAAVSSAPSCLWREASVR